MEGCRAWRAQRVQARGAAVVERFSKQRFYGFLQRTTPRRMRALHVVVPTLWYGSSASLRLHRTQAAHPASLRSPLLGARAENKGWRLDYAFVDKEFDTSDVVDVSGTPSALNTNHSNVRNAPPLKVGILKRVGGSDHCPIMVKLKPQPTLPPHSPPSLSSKRRSRQGKLISFFGRGAGTHGNKQPRVAANVATEERQVCKVETEKKEHQAGDVSGGGGAKEVLTQQAEENIFKAQGSKAVGIPASLEGTTTTAFTKAKPPKQKEHIKKRVSSETLAQTKGQTSMMTFLGKRKER